ncbi:hypothetical protein VTK73DRAFT_4888 [Phialemonium thermophilum]|uniref:Enoyl reductase (ER) domain-containing protein n=1 Tax=Phialemonium thermophilum TaxID=223376 RepID=A0ABR3WR45_9PEZI
MAPPAPSTMKAWVVARRGAPRNALTLRTDHPVPVLSPSSSSLLVRISYAALNPVDLVLMQLAPTWIPFLRSQPVAGIDFCGTVVRAGSAAPADLSNPGTEVCGTLSLHLIVAGHGTLAEYVVVPADLVAPVPKRWKTKAQAQAQAAGLGVVGQTAVIAVREAGLRRVESEEGVEGARVLVNGASGGLGVMLVQICKGLGLKVTGICSGRNTDFVGGLGADETIDYTVHQPLTAYLATRYAEQPFDFIFDTVGDLKLFDHSTHYLKPSGKLISLVGGKTQGVWPFVRNRLWPRLLGGTPRTYRLLGLVPSGSLQRQVVEWVEEGIIKEVPIDSEHSMENALEGYDRVISRRAKGKIVIKID